MITATRSGSSRSRPPQIHVEPTQRTRPPMSSPAANYFSSLGRFMTPDWSASPEPVPYAKLFAPQSLNLYVYLEDNAVSGVDADGHACDVCPTMDEVDAVAKELIESAASGAESAGAAAGATVLGAVGGVLALETKTAGSCGDDEYACGPTDCVSLRLAICPGHCLMPHCTAPGGFPDELGWAWPDESRLCPRSTRHSQFKCEKIAYVIALSAW